MLLKTIFRHFNCYCRLLQWMARMHLDFCNVMPAPKITQKLLWLVLSDEICLISSHNSTGGAVCVWGKVISLSLPEWLMEFHKLVLNFVSLGKILWCDHSNEISSTVLSHGTIYLVCSFNFWVCGQNPVLRPFNSWSIYLVCCSNFWICEKKFQMKPLCQCFPVVLFFLSILQNKIWK